MNVKGVIEVISMGCIKRHVETCYPEKQGQHSSEKWTLLMFKQFCANKALVLILEQVCTEHAWHGPALWAMDIPISTIAMICGGLWSRMNPCPTGFSAWWSLFSGKRDLVWWKDLLFYKGTCIIFKMKDSWLLCLGLYCRVTSNSAGLIRACYWDIQRTVLVCLGFW